MVFRIVLEKLFSPGKIGEVWVKNRIVRSATYDGRADKGYISENQIDFYSQLAEGGTGLIITGATVVHFSGSGGRNQAYLLDGSYIPSHQKLVNVIHDFSEVKVAIQLVHMGRQNAHPKFPPIAPSAVPNLLTKLTPRELTLEEIEDLIKSFVDAGRRAYEAGYDLIQLHAAHDYLLNNFICPYTNIRNDEFGGTTEKRTKILVDIFNQLRDQIGRKCPIFIKMNTIDGFPNGIDLEEAKKIAKILIDTGYTAIEPSGGSQETMTIGEKINPSYSIKKPEEENYFLKNAKALKNIENCCPIVLVGGVRNPVAAEKILKANHADFISMSRPLIREPDLPNRWKNGNLSPAECISCNACYGTMMTGEVYCVPKRKIEKRKQREAKKANK